MAAGGGGGGGGGGVANSTYPARPLWAGESVIKHS